MIYSCLMKKNIILHLGTHKTATTFMQEILERNAKLLESLDIKSYTPNILRKLRYGGMLRSSLSHKLAADEFAEINKKLITDPLNQTIVISEENLIGTPRDFLQSKSLYTQSDKLLGGLSKQMEAYNVKILICLRSLSTFLPSMYCEYIRNNPNYLSFADFYSKINIKKASWFELMQAVQRNFPTGEIVVWDYSVLREKGGMRMVLKELIPGVSPDDLSMPSKVVRSGMTHRCMNLIGELHRHLSVDEYQQIKQFLDCRMQWCSDDKFQPFKQGEIDRLDKNHKLALTKITNNKTNIRIITP